MRWTDIPQPYTMDTARSFVQRARAKGHEGKGAAFAIVDPVTDQAIGSMTLHGPDGHRAMFGYWLHPAARGRGLGSRALRLISDWTLDAHPEVVRLETYAMVGNDASMRVMETAGFQREGVLRQWDTHRGQPSDVVFYSRLRSE